MSSVFIYVIPNFRATTQISLLPGTYSVSSFSTCVLYQHLKLYTTRKQLNFSLSLVLSSSFPVSVIDSAILRIILKSFLSFILGFPFYQQNNFYSLISLKYIPSLYFLVVTNTHLDCYNNLNGVPLLLSLRIHFVQRIIFTECTCDHVFAYYHSVIPYWHQTSPIHPTLHFPYSRCSDLSPLYIFVHLLNSACKSHPLSHALPA